jgi:Protein of unknown function (DUF3499)
MTGWLLYVHDVSGCGRPGCSAPAAAAIGFDASRQAVWLHPLDEPEATGRLCRAHADSLRPPRGWRFFDYREPATPQSDVADLLDARSPLLERAFRGARAS